MLSLKSERHSSSMSEQVCGYDATLKEIRVGLNM
jgi:hypothetical protein